MANVITMNAMTKKKNWRWPWPVGTWIYCDPSESKKKYTWKKTREIEKKVECVGVREFLCEQIDIWLPPVCIAWNVEIVSQCLCLCHISIFDEGKVHSERTARFHHTSNQLNESLTITIEASAFESHCLPLTSDTYKAMAFYNRIGAKFNSKSALQKNERKLEISTK